MKQVTTRVSKREYEHLASFCEATERTESDVIRFPDTQVVNLRGIEPHRLTAYPSRHHTR